MLDVVFLTDLPFSGIWLTLTPRKHGISFHCYADDSQIYVPLKKKNEYSVKLLLICIDNIKAWVALNVFNFNDKKTKVMVCGGTTGNPA